MANQNITFKATADQTLRLFPEEQYALSLADWATYVKTTTQAAAPNKGRYTATVDDTYRYWLVFIGADQPTDWGQAEYTIDIQENSWPLTDQQTENLIEILGLDNEPFVPTPIVVPPPEDDALSGGYGHTYDENEEIIGDVEVNFQLIRGPGTTGQSLSTAVRTITSNEDGELTGYFRKGATYRAWTDEIQQHVVFEVPDTDTFALPEIIRW